MDFPMRYVGCTNASRLEQCGQGRLTLAIALALPCTAAFAQGGEAPAVSTLAFNSDFLRMGGGSSEPVDLTTVLRAGNNILPGSYRIDIAVNGALVGRRDVMFALDADSELVKPCLTVEMLDTFGIDLAPLEADGRIARTDAARCYDLEGLFDQASVEYDSGRLRLNISVPQAYMLQGLRGYVDPALWDQGVTAGYINYQLNSRQERSRGKDGNSTFIGLQSGLNLGPWRLRNEASLSKSSGGSWNYSRNRTFFQRDITALKSQLAIGEIFTDSSLFDSSRIRGVKLESDDSMLADSERGYAPVIRGTAESNATVEVRQGGFVLYTTSVPPGPFALTNIFPSGSNGDLEITVIEADGRRRVSTQAYSSLPLMLRKGRMKYSVAAGRYHGSDSRQETPNLLSANLTYGLGDNLTGTTGVQASDDFFAVNLGVGTNTPIGAVSADITHSDSKARGQHEQGQSLRMLYAKTFAATYTNFTLAAYRYSTEGYRSFNDHINDLSYEQDGWRSGRSRARLDLTVNQRLGGEGDRYGSLYLNVGDQSYWGGRGRSQSLSAGYGNNWRQLNYNINVTRTRNVMGWQEQATINDTQAMLSLSMPLGATPRAPRAALNVSRDNDGRFGTQAGINGNLPGDLASFYSVQAGRSAAGNSNGSASLGATLPLMQVDAGYSQGSGYKSASVGAAGSVVVHAGGVNLGHQVGETFALAKVDGVERARVANYANSRTGRNGYAVVPYAQPYRINQIALDTQNMGANIEMENTIQQVVPRRGAVVKAYFTGKSGRRVQFQLQRGNGAPLPFGANVLDEQGRQLTITDPNGKALVLLDQDQGTLTVQWDGGSCMAPYLLGERNAALNYERVKLVCE